MNVYKNFIRPLLFSLDPETAHGLSIAACRYGGLIPGIGTLLQHCLNVSAPQLQCEVAGIRFANPIGLAAGWDKSGQALRMLGALGFGFAEIGSISSQASLGNPRPRLLRLPLDQAIVVNYGLPNQGAERVAERLNRSTVSAPLGVNIVKTNFGPSAPPCSANEILADYVQSVVALQSHASYLMLNLSCPNAEGGQDFFAQPGNILRLLQELQSRDVKPPVFLKVAPDATPPAIDRLIAESIDFAFVKGFMFNLPTGKPASIKLKSSPEIWQKMPGAVAGQPVASLINDCIRELYSRMPVGRFHLIAAGGIFTAQDAYLKVRLGASLVQLYTALIYEGPQVVANINRGLIELLERDGFESISQAVGQPP